ncbi:DUF2513 domain-containing protein [Hyphomonas jannaschiana]|uniref:DUF2513 domain-containing protein n=1 Tax=Hyphomonas jannaschiana VP2 TaxID=1280952 RepID=A0A059FC09_9PROT|nr:DUF2513 domain-containing protein [Hyphomonas jannaschiana]KCZ88038.1 hypothetical protein HJA_10665 [Hyphomonas jannaschiana VP2]
MKRDADLLRKILLAAEAKSDDGLIVTLTPEDLPHPNFEEVMWSHVLVLEDLGYIAHEQQACDESVDVGRITAAGYDFLDSVRDDEVWRKTKEAAASAGGFTIDLLGDLAKGLIKTQIKRLTGVEV